MKIHEIIKNHMLVNGINSLAELSRKADIPLTTLNSLMENKTKSPHSITLTKLANYFNIRISELTGMSLLDENINFKNTAQLLKYLMKDLHLTERELSRSTGVTQSAIHNILNHKTQKPNIKTATLISNFFKISLDEFYVIKQLKKREKGAFTNIYQEDKTLSFISFKQILFLPESLKQPEFGFVHSKNLYADFIVEFQNKKIFAKIQKTFNKKDLIICNTHNGIKFGNIKTKNEKMIFIPLFSDEDIFEIEKKFFICHAKIVEINDEKN